MPDSSDVHEDGLLGEVAITVPGKKKRKKKTELSVTKYNHNHGSDGRFSYGDGGGHVAGATADHAFWPGVSLPGGQGGSSGEIGAELHAASNKDMRERLNADPAYVATKYAGLSADAIKGYAHTDNFAQKVAEGWNQDASGIRPSMMEAAVARKFGMPEHTVDVSKSPEPAALYDRYAEIQYSKTQSLLHEKGVKSVTLYRGVDRKPTESSALESWSTSPDVAYKFTYNSGYMVRATIPASNIFSIAGHGPGAVGEREVMVIGKDVVPERLVSVQDSMGFRNANAMTEITKYNHNHGEDGRFSSGGTKTAHGTVRVTPKSGKPEDYASTRMAHQAPTNDGYNAPMHAADRDMYPSDVYGPNGARYYGSGTGQKMDESVIATMRAVRGKPDETVQVFRTINAHDNGKLPAAELRPGDWVTPSLGYAKMHQRTDRKSIIVEATVPAKHLYTDANSLQEWGYDPTPDSIQKYNHNHGADGRFSSSDAGGSLGKSVHPHVGDMEDMRNSSITSKHVQPDGTFTPERARLHDKIVSDFLRGVPSREHPTQYFNGGGPGAGKSSMTSGANAKLVGYPGTRHTDEFGKMDFERVPTPDAVLIDPDAVKLQLPEVQAMLKAGDTTWAHEAHAESSYISKRLMQAALDRKVHIVNDGTGDSGAEKMIAKAKQAKDAGYRTEANYLHLNPEEGVRRALARAQHTGRMVPPTVIRHTYANLPDVFAKTQEGVFDNVRLFENDGVPQGQPARLIGATNNGGFEIFDQGAYDNFMAGH